MMRPGGLGIRPMIESDVTLFPQPDSPTMPIVWPGITEKETSSTAISWPPSTRKAVLRFFTSRTGLLIGPLLQRRIKAVAESVAHDIQGQHHDQHRETGRR